MRTNQPPHASNDCAGCWRTSIAERASFGTLSFPLKIVVGFPATREGGRESARGIGVVETARGMGIAVEVGFGEAICMPSAAIRVSVDFIEAKSTIAKPT